MQQSGPTIELDEASTSNSVDSTVADSIRNHPLMPILELLCEKCADATETMQPRAFQMNDVFKVSQSGQIWNRFENLCGFWSWSIVIYSVVVLYIQKLNRSFR
nr:Protein PSA-3, isoform c [Haemonchus contortus]